MLRASQRHAFTDCIRIPNATGSLVERRAGGISYNIYIIKRVYIYTLYNSVSYCYGIKGNLLTYHNCSSLTDACFFLLLLFRTRAMKLN